jgi:hypothetical protein
MRVVQLWREKDVCFLGIEPNMLANKEEFVSTYASLKAVPKDGEDGYNRSWLAPTGDRRQTSTLYHM